MLKYSVGLDISKASFHAAISTIDTNQKVKVERSGSFDNNEEGFKRLLAWIQKEHRHPAIPLVITMEATGVYYEWLAVFLHDQKLAVAVVLPNKTQKYILALGIKTKNDAADARALSRMGAEQALELWEPMGAFFYTLRALTRHYQQLQELSTVLNNHSEAISCGAAGNVEAVTRSNEALHPGKAIAKAISAHLHSDEDVARKVGHINAITGVADLTAGVILGETGGFALFKNARQLISYCGYDVVDDQSGTRVGKTKISKKGNGRIRRCLHMPALCAVRWKVKVFTDLYERVYKRSGIKMKGYVAVQKKLLTTIYALWKTDTCFDPQYWSRNNAAAVETETAKASADNAGEVKTTSDEEAAFSSRHSGREEMAAAAATHAAQKLAPRKGRAKQGIQPSDESAYVSSRHTKANQKVF